MRTMETKNGVIITFGDIWLPGVYESKDVAIAAHDFALKGSANYEELVGIQETITREMLNRITGG